MILGAASQFAFSYIMFEVFSKCLNWFTTDSMDLNIVLLSTTSCVAQAICKSFLTGPQTPIVIYTRTSSKSSFKTKSVNRQINTIQSSFSFNPPHIVFSDRCSCEVSLFVRENFLSAVKAAIELDSVIYVEDISRIGRMVSVQNEGYIINRLFARVIPVNHKGFFDEPAFKEWEVRIPYISKVLLSSKQDILNKQSQTRDQYRAEGKKFDGRKTLTELNPDIVKEMNELRDDGFSYREISQMLADQGVQSSKNKPFSASVIQKYTKRSYSTQLRWEVPEDPKDLIDPEDLCSPEAAPVEVGVKPQVSKGSNSATSVKTKVSKGTKGSSVEWSELNPIEFYWKLKKDIFFYKDLIVYIGKEDNFYWYQGSCWTLVSKARIKAELFKLTGISKQTHLSYFIQQVQIRNYQEEFPDASEYIGFRNKVQRMSDKTLHSHDYQFYLRSMNIQPYDYVESTVSPIHFPEIQNWLNFVSGDNKDILQFLYSYINQIVCSISKHQIFLELMGPGGSGKSTMLTQQTALVGKENVVSSNLKLQESSRFETATIFNKKLILITDSDYYAGSMSVIKAIVGQDAIRFEEKNKQPNKGFVFKGQQVIALNELLRSSDYTSGLMRRKVTIVFNRKPTATKQLISITGKEIKGNFAKEIPYFQKFIIQMDPAQVESTIINRHQSFLASVQSQVLLDVNPISEFIYYEITQARGFMTDVKLPLFGKVDQGLWNKYIQFSKYNYEDYINKIISRRAEDLQEEEFDKKRIHVPTTYNIYSTYCYYCQTRNISPLALNRFNSLFKEHLDINKFNYTENKSSKGIYYTGIMLKNVAPFKFNCLEQTIETMKQLGLAKSPFVVQSEQAVETIKTLGLNSPYSSEPKTRLKKRSNFKRPRTRRPPVSRQSRE